MKRREYRFYIYIISNYNRSTFYVGVTNNLARRIIEHKKGLGSAFTRKYNLKVLLYYEMYRYADIAFEREKEIKKWRREKKLNLIKEMNSDFKDLSGEVFEYYDISQDEVMDIALGLKEHYVA